jgi:hypothetical protein
MLKVRAASADDRRVTPELDVQERRALRRKVRAAILDTLSASGGEAQRRAIVERVLADGRFTAAELAAPAPEKAREGCERLVDHLLAWELTNLKRDGLVENPRWATWRMADAAVEAQPVLLAEAVDPDRLAMLEQMPYDGYLRTPEWRRTRAAAILRAGHRCALDASHTGTLHVHHNSYDGPRGAERSIDLTVLCEDCHNLHHRVNGRPGPRAAPSSSPAHPKTDPRGASIPPPGWDGTARSGRPSLLRRLLGSV